MAGEEKPYRLYRGGRKKGKVPTVSRSRVRSASEAGRGDSSRAEYRGPGAPGTKRGPRWGLRIGLGIAGLVVLLVIWIVAGWLSLASGVSDANKRLDPNAKSALATQNGLLLSHSTTVLMLGTDNAQIVGRTGDDHSDSIMLLRTDPSHHRLYYLSIPRDLQVP